MTQFKATPADHSSDTVVTFESDVSGCVFQWRLIDYTYNTVIRNWTTTAITTCETCASEGRLDLTWLPKGMLRLRIRAVDAAGHVEPTFREGENQHTWTYVPPFPWLILIGVLLASSPSRWPYSWSSGGGGARRRWSDTRSSACAASSRAWTRGSRRTCRTGRSRRR